MQYLQYGSSILASDSLAVGRVPVGARYQGETFIDAWLPFRADYSTVYGKGRGPREYSVTVQRFFSTIAAAKAFALSHEDTLPVQDDLTWADDTAGVAYTMADAVCSARIVQQIGVSIIVEYTFTGGRFESDDVPGSLEETDTLKTYEYALAINDEAKAVVFTTPFATTPKFVRGEITGPASTDAGVAIDAKPINSTRTAEGVTFEFTQKIPATGYSLLVLASL